VSRFFLPSSLLTRRFDSEADSFFCLCVGSMVDWENDIWSSASYVKAALAAAKVPLSSTSFLSRFVRYSFPSSSLITRTSPSSADLRSDL